MYKKRITVGHSSAIACKFLELQKKHQVVELSHLLLYINKQRKWLQFRLQVNFKYHRPVLGELLFKPL